MKASAAVSIACLVTRAGAANNVQASAASVTPVQKVITLLGEMLAKGKDEKHQEEVQFAAYKQWCDDTSAEKTAAIKEAEEHMEMLKADIQKAIADSQVLAQEIAEHDGDIATWNGDKKAAGKVREMELADYQATHTDYSESISALQRAIAVLKKQAYDRKQAASLAEVKDLNKLKLIPDEAKRSLALFLVQQEPSDVTPPEAAGYEFQSAGIVEMLEKLLDKFTEEKTTLEKEEMNSRHAYEMLVADLVAQVQQATKDSTSKSQLKAKTLQQKAENEGNLQDTTTTRDADKKYLDDTTATCKNKASDFQARQQLRAEEIEAIQKAIDILSSDTVSGAADEHLPGAAASASASSLVQLRGEGRSPVQERAAEYLKDQAASLNSRVLSTLALHVADDPFGKVKQMIKDLIVRLMEEANEETEHKGWCDTELSTNEQTRKEKTDAVEILHAEIDELQASIAQLGEEIAEHTQEVADLTSAMAKATEIRTEEKATNEATIKDSQEAQTAVAQALVVLKEFYAKAAESTAFLQSKQLAKNRQHQQKQPEIFDSPYQGMQGESGGVVGMLEVIQSDFARLETETDAAEVSAQKEYDQMMIDSKVDKATKEKDIEHKTAQKQTQQQAVTAKQGDLEGTQKELDAALSYFDKLKPSCVDAGVSYDDRVARRKEEIESLQEALRILNGEDIA